MASILVVAAREDWPTDRVVKTLTDRGARVFRIDAADFPQEATLTGYIGNTHGWGGKLHTSQRALDLPDVVACYFRAPNPFRLSADMSEPERRFAAAQARAGFGGILTALNCRWVNHPSAMSRAEYKPVQLAAARLVSLSIPATLITNNSHEVRAFARGIPGPIICKPVASPSSSRPPSSRPSTRDASLSTTSSTYEASRRRPTCFRRGWTRLTRSA